MLTGLLGNGIRLLGVILALLPAYLIWGPKPKPFSSVKKYVAIALLCEGIYFLSLLPLSIIEVIRGIAPILMFGFILRILLVSPVLIILGRKTWRYTESARTSVLNWVKSGWDMLLNGHMD